MIVRRLFVAAWVTLFACAAVTGAQARVRLGLEGGINQAMVTRPANELDLESRYRPAWSLGPVVVVPLGSRLSAAAGLRYIEYGDRFGFTLSDADGPVFSMSVHTVWKYLSLPAQVRIRPLAGRRLYLALGPEVGYLLEARSLEHLEFLRGYALPAVQHAARPAANIFEDIGTFGPDQTRLYYRWNLALAGGLGYEFPVGPHAGLAEARYTHGLTDIARPGSLVRRTRGFEALLGFLW
jgi:hypothetical protein